MIDKFTIPNIDFAYAEVEVQFDNSEEGNVIALNDVTYDNFINFATLIRTERDLLNIDPVDYTQDLELPRVDIELGSDFGDWKFNEDPLGKVINIVKTVKLSGKGYNIKTVFVDFTRSKWTLETLGIAYRLRRTRSG
jgi:hypothetical protein